MPEVARSERMATRLVIWCSLFPYLTIVPFMQIDTQPWAMLAAGLALLLLWPQLEISVIHVAAFTLVLAALLLFLLDNANAGALRTLAGYLSLFLIAVITTHAYRIDPAGALRAIDSALLIWLGVGLVQRFISRDAFTWLISDARTTELRGVISLAPEPTIFASTILLIILWRSLLDVRPWHIVLAFFVVFVLASSSQVAIIVAVSAGAFALTSVFRPRYMMPALLLLLAGVALIASMIAYLPPTRLGQLVELVIKNPALLLADESANERAVHIFASVSSVWFNSFLPSGIDGGAWLHYVNSIISKFPQLFWVPQHNDRVMSALGAIFFQMGFLSLPLIFAVAVAVFRWGRAMQYRLVWSTTFVLLILTAIPLSHPMIGAIVGALAYVSRKGHSQIAPPPEVFA